MLARALLYVLLIPAVLAATTLVRHEVVGRTYCLDDRLAASSAAHRSAYCVTVPDRLPAPEQRPHADLSGLFGVLGH